MLDMKWLSDNVEFAKKNLSQRNFDISLLDNVLLQNNQRKDLIKKVEESRAEINKLSKEVGVLKSKGQDASVIMNNVSELKKAMAGNEESLKIKEEELENTLLYIPNILSDEVPFGKDETLNKEVFQWGKVPEFTFPVQDHVAIGERLKLMDFDAAAQMTGARFVVLKGSLARLERALANFMIDYHLHRGYQEVAPPYIVHAKSLVGTGQWWWTARCRWWITTPTARPRIRRNRRSTSRPMRRPSGASSTTFPERAIRTCCRESRPISR